MYNPKEYRIPPYVPSPSGMKGMAHIGATNLTMLSGRLSIEYILLAPLEQGTLTCPNNMPTRPPHRCQFRAWHEIASHEIVVI